MYQQAKAFSDSVSKGDIQVKHGDNSNKTNSPI
jgi:hypothetical protein